MIGERKVGRTMGDDRTDPERRIDDLEARLAFQDDTIQALDRALSDQQQQITRLAKSVQVLLEQLENREDDGDPPEAEPPPPHY
jgi:SlyX protein